MNSVLLICLILCNLGHIQNDPTTCLHHAPGLINSTTTNSRMTETNVINGLPASKVCSKCNVDKPADQFTVRHDRAKPRLVSACKDCACAASVSFRKGNTDYQQRERERMSSPERRAYITSYHEKNREHIAAKAKARYVKPVRLSCPVYYVTCPETGLLFTSKSKTRRLSDEGQLIVNQRKALLREQQNYVARVFECKQCKGSFSPTYGDKRRSYCSDECADKAKLVLSKKLNKYHRRARHYGVAFVRFDINKVFERDKWTCQLCGVPTPKLKRGSYDDNAPELDHVIAMSKGGPHTPDNTQCLCRKCNREKGVKVVGQQRLFA